MPQRNRCEPSAKGSVCRNASSDDQTSLRIRNERRLDALQECGDDRLFGRSGDLCRGGGRDRTFA
jgi:hypothetical protein